MNAMLPAWFRQEIPGRHALDVSRLLLESDVHTVCKEASCPNSGRCFGESSATFMILGNICTRNCSFCNISDVGTGYYPNRRRGGLNLPYAGGAVYHSVPTERPSPTAIDESEPDRIAALVDKLGLDYAVITSVSRDDLPDGGAETFARTVEAIRRRRPGIKIEVLIPDFGGKTASLERLLASRPDVVGHNIETVSYLYPQLRPQASYRLSLKVLKRIKSLRPRSITKSSLMLGLGETRDEVIRAMRDLRAHNCDCLVLGQYLAPSAAHYPVKEFIEPARFQAYRGIGLGIGFKSVLAYPLARSSYRAKQMYQEATEALCMN